MTDRTPPPGSAVRCEVEAGVCTILLDRPGVHNAQNETMLVELDAALAFAASAPAVRVVVLGGTGRSFSSGHDLSLAPKDGAPLSRPAGAEDRWRYERERFYDQAVRLWELPKPTIARVQGHCLAAGLVLAGMCDLVIAAEDATFGDPVLRMGAISSEVLILPWIVGVHRAKRMLFTGEPIDARTALAWGLVTDVVPVADLDAATARVAKVVGGMPPFAIRMLKRSINRTVESQGLRAALEGHFDAHVLGHMTEEAHARLEPADRGDLSVRDFVRRRDEGFEDRP